MRTFKWIVGSAIVSAIVSALFTPEGKKTRGKLSSFFKRLGMKLGFDTSPVHDESEGKGPEKRSVSESMADLQRQRTSMAR